MYQEMESENNTLYDILKPAYIGLISLLDRL
ncbi:hypothetical protein SAMN05216285_3299 [Natrinema salifodinae]|uniref:Uncharacterized protein n=1 Tax=Natrinema salifodinae TaxID=1202768 RepID=A0A1I0QA98_9EURY|nr:hypothetical protein SAMN05216285_3299 [Natrinema salifodinae]